MLDGEPELAGRGRRRARRRRRWNLELEGGIDVRLPEIGAPKPGPSSPASNASTGVLQRDVDSIDLRQPDRLVLRTPPKERPAAAHHDGKNT